MISYEKNKVRLQAPNLEFRQNPKRDVQKFLSNAKSDSRTSLFEHEAKKVLSLHDIHVPTETLIRSESDLQTIPEIMRDHLISMKIVSKDILHKTDAGCVKLNLSSQENLRENYQLILSNALTYNPNAVLEGSFDITNGKIWT